MTDIDIKQTYGKKNCFNSWHGKEAENKCYNNFRESTDQTYKVIRNAEMNLFDRSKISFFHSVGGKAVETPVGRIYLHVYKMNNLCYNPFLPLNISLYKVV